MDIGGIYNGLEMKIFRPFLTASVVVRFHPQGAAVGVVPEQAFIAGTLFSSQP